MPSLLQQIYPCSAVGQTSVCFADNRLHLFIIAKHCAVHKYGQLCLIRTLCGIVKAFELQNVRITEAPMIGVFCQEIYKGRENFVRISNSNCKGAN